MIVVLLCKAWWRLQASVLKQVLGQLVAYGTIYFAFHLWSFTATNCLCFSASFPQSNSTLGNVLLVLAAIKGSRNLTKTFKIIAYFAYLFQTFNLAGSLLPWIVCWAGGGSTYQIHNEVLERDGSCIRLSYFTSDLLRLASADGAWIWYTGKHPAAVHQLQQPLCYLRCSYTGLVRT